ncbi:MAG: hypothetical protein MRJ92_12875 [Nitrospira sp.]|nr:hypothetical protein [Nitrospira sp.]
MDVLGTTGETNVQGEVVKRLDMIANDTFLRVFEHSGLVCVLASEEMEKPIQLPQHWPKGKYMLLFDHLDGSSNTDVNMPLGAIFRFLKHDGRGRLRRKRNCSGEGNRAGGRRVPVVPDRVRCWCSASVSGCTGSRWTRPSGSICCRTKISGFEEGQVYAANEAIIIAGCRGPRNMSTR